MSERGVLAIIPARGGSKGIPRKNLLSIAGRPLLAYSVEQALSCRNISRVVVSTEDEEIAAVALSCGAEVPVRRPPNLADDHSTDLEVFEHMLIALQEREGYSCELVVHLRPTGPVRKVEIIEQSIDLMKGAPHADSLRSVSPAEQTPYKMWRMDGPYLEPLLTLDGVPECWSRPRQELPEVFWQNGYVDVIRPRTILEGHSMTGRRVLPLVIDSPPLELDYPDSIPKVEAAVRAMLRGEWPAPFRRHAS